MMISLLALGILKAFSLYFIIFSLRLGEIDEISVNRISNCDDCYNLLEKDPPVYCYAEHTWVNGSIVLDIPWAIITKVVFGYGFPSSMQMPYFATLGTFPLNRTGSRVIRVDVCVKEETCSLCGSMVFGEDGWPGTTGLIPTESINCEQETQGNIVKVTQVNNLGRILQPCTLHLHGKGKYQVKHLSFNETPAKHQDIFR